MGNERKKLDRRQFVKTTAKVIGGTAAIGAGLTASRANNHAHKHENSIDELDYNTYTNNVEIHGSFTGLSRPGSKMQMMAKGQNRYLFMAGSVVDVTDPLNPEIVNLRAYQGGQNQLAYNAKMGKWILMTGAAPPPTSSTLESPNGKYDDPGLATAARFSRGLRGVRIYDATDPLDIKLMSEWSCDQGDPSREVQTGGGTHRNYYDGGRYAYLDAGPDNSFIHMESPVRLYSNCLQIIDMEDPGNPKFVSNWWFPGQRAGEERRYRLWREFNDHQSFTSAHGAFYVPKRIEDGGKYAYCSYGSFGMTVHDVSDPANPRLVGRWQPPYLPGAIPFHTADVSWIDRGFIIGTSETLNPDCFEPFHDNYVLDISDPENPEPIASFGRWVPPADAPYESFCDKRGRYGTHNPPHLKAPGKRHPSFIGYSAFNAGFQFMDFTDPTAPRVNGWFIPPTGGGLDRPGSFNRIGDSIFIEWDRKLIWLGADSGVYLASHPDLGTPDFEPRAVTEWTIDGLNEGHDG